MEGRQGLNHNIINNNSQ